jgi:hypothetical protein
MEYKTADLSPEAIVRLSQHEQAFSNEAGEDIVLIAYGKGEDAAPENQSYEEQIADLSAEMSDVDEMSNDRRENPFLFPPIEPQGRNDLT